MTTTLTNDEVDQALQLAVRLECAYNRGLIDPTADSENLKLLWVLHHMGYLFEWEDWQKFEKEAMEKEAAAHD